MNVPEPTRHTVKLRQACRQLDALTLDLDRIIAQLEIDLCQNPLNLYRCQQAQADRVARQSSAS